MLIAYDFVASVPDRAAVNPGWERYEKLTYSPAVRSGDVLFMSGQAALDPATERAVHAGDVGAQAEYTYRNIIEVLDAAGFGPQNLIKTIEYVTPAGLARYRDVAAVREKLLQDPWPASTGCAVPLIASARIRDRDRPDGDRCRRGRLSVLLTPGIAALVGTSASYVAPEPIGRSSIRYFAGAIGDDNSIYFDDDAARDAGYEGVRCSLDVRL